MITSSILGLLLKEKPRVVKLEAPEEGLSRQEKEKRQNLEKIKSYLQGKSKVNNDEIQQMLGVSDATTERYLDELEAGGAVKQVGKTGRHVYYAIFK